MNHQVLPSITTTDNPDWRQQIAEISTFSLATVALFITGLDFEQRQECYRLLERIPNLTIPFVHARTDMDVPEFTYLINRFQTQLFNIHALQAYPLQHDYSLYADRILIENTYHFSPAPDLPRFGGLCLDLSHLEILRLFRPAAYYQLIQLTHTYPVPANHVSAINPKHIFIDDSGQPHANHHLQQLSDLDYLRHFPARCFSSLIAIELTNSLSEQLRARDYVSSVLKAKN